MEVRPDSSLQSVKVNMLTRVVTLIGHDGEMMDVENNTADEISKKQNIIFT